MTFYIKGRNKYERVQFSDIKHLSAASQYTHVVTTKKEYVISHTLQYVTGWLSKYDKQKKLLKIHRSTVVNIDHVDSIEGNLLFIGDKPFQIAKPKREEVMKHFVFI